MRYRLLKTILISSLLVGGTLTSTAAETEQTLIGVGNDRYLTCVVDDKRVSVEEKSAYYETKIKSETGEPLATEYEIDLIAVVVMGEAEGESEEGKRLVVDTILNRVDSEYFPDTIEEVIYQKGAYECMWNGRIYDCWSDEEICELVREELESRTNNDVIYFTAGYYGPYGEPLFQVGNHYFASY